MPFTQGQILENSYGKRMVLCVLTEDLYVLSKENDFKRSSTTYSLAEVAEMGYKPVFEKWKPKLKEQFWFVDAFGEPTWDNYKDGYEFAVLIGNCFPFTDDGLRQVREYRQWLLDNPYKPI